MSPQQVVDVSVPRGLDALAIADHYTIAGAQAAREIAHSLVVIGGEIPRPTVS